MKKILTLILTLSFAGFANAGTDINTAVKRLDNIISPNIGTNEILDTSLNKYFISEIKEFIDEGNSGRENEFAPLIDGVDEEYETGANYLQDENMGIKATSLGTNKGVVSLDNGFNISVVGSPFRNAEPGAIAGQDYTTIIDQMDLIPYKAQIILPQPGDKINTSTPIFLSYFKTPNNVKGGKTEFRIYTGSLAIVNGGLDESSATKIDEGFSLDVTNGSYTYFLPNVALGNASDYTIVVRNIDTSNNFKSGWNKLSGTFEINSLETTVTESDLSVKKANSDFSIVNPIQFDDSLILTDSDLNLRFELPYMQEIGIQLLDSSMEVNVGPTGNDLGGNNFQANSNIVDIKMSNLSEGINEFIIFAKNGLGEVIMAKPYIIKVDSKAPELLNIELLNDQDISGYRNNVITDDFIKISYNIKDANPLSSAYYVDDFGNNIDIPTVNKVNEEFSEIKDISISGFKEGQKITKVCFVDIASNESCGFVNYFLNNTVNSVKILSPNGGEDFTEYKDSTTVNGQTDLDIKSAKVIFNGVEEDLNLGTEFFQKSGIINFSRDLVDGENTFKFIFEDYAGNTGSTILTSLGLQKDVLTITRQAALSDGSEEGGNDEQLVIYGLEANDAEFQREGKDPDKPSEIIQISPIEMFN